MLEYEQTQTGTAPQYCVIWLHGLGADGHDFAPVVPQLNLPPAPAIRFIFPHAPMQPVTINGGYVMRAWYDIVAMDLRARQDKDGIVQSAQQIMELVDDQQQQGIGTQNIVLAGFSQGAALALHLGLRSGIRFAGVMALSGYLPLAEEMPVEPTDAPAQCPIFMAHGADDPIVPLAAGTESRQRLESLGYHIDWHEYPMEHSVCGEEIADISRWLQRVTGIKS
ncbi:MAG: dienelactone hydrolase family protein [Gammaproteobacteria bacterium]|jgi:phospholipase/carboxylesterase